MRDKWVERNSVLDNPGIRCIVVAHEKDVYYFFFVFEESVVMWEGIGWFPKGKANARCPKNCNLQFYLLKQELLPPSY